MPGVVENCYFSLYCNYSNMPGQGFHLSCVKSTDFQAQTPEVLPHFWSPEMHIFFLQVFFFFLIYKDVFILFILAAPLSLWDLPSLATCLAVNTWSPNHWTIGEFSHPFYCVKLQFIHFSCFTVIDFMTVAMFLFWSFAFIIIIAFIFMWV